MMLPLLTRLSVSKLGTGAPKRARGDAPPPIEFLDVLPDDVKIQVLLAVQNDDCTALSVVCTVNKAFRDICADKSSAISILKVVVHGEGRDDVTKNAIRD